jgi:hypothetical protein
VSDAGNAAAVFENRHDLDRHSAGPVSRLEGHLPLKACPSRGRVFVNPRHVRAGQAMKHRLGGCTVDRYFEVADGRTRAVDPARHDEVPHIQGCAFAGLLQCAFELGMCEGT